MKSLIFALFSLFHTKKYIQNLWTILFRSLRFVHFSESLMISILYVRFVDMCWLHFVKTIVLARCQTRCLNMLVRHHSVPWSAYLEIYFKREDSWIFSEDLIHVNCCPRSVWF